MIRVGPALPRMQGPEALRVLLGIVSGLGVTQLGLWLLAGGDLLAHPLLIAPFGASAVLVYAVPASPLAQPWSVVVGNAVAAGVALAVIALGSGLWPVLTLCLAAGLAVAAMGLARALHPPGGAVAVATVLSAQAGHAPGLPYLFGTVALGSALLVLWGMVYGRATARAYPVQAPPPAPAPASPLALAAALGRLHLAEQIRPEDLSALIAETARIEAQLRLPEVGAMMTRAPVSLTPDDSLPQMRAAFRAHGHRVLPVTLDGRFEGLVAMTDVLEAAPDLTARDLARPAVSVAPAARLAEVLAPLAQGAQSAVPVVQEGRLVGIVTRSDLLAALLT